MAPEVRHVPEVLAGRHGLDCRAFATRRTDSLEAARLILVNAVERLPGVAVFHFNLACYAAQLGELDRAKASLSRAIELQPGYRQQALEDEDLRPIWETL